MARGADDFTPIVGRAYRLRLSAGNPNNCTLHIRAIVDTYQVVVAIHGKHRGWYYRIEDLRLLRMWRAEGKLRLAPNAALNDRQRGADNAPNASGGRSNA